MGGNANLLLNVPPSARGVIEPSDVEALRGVKAHIDSFRAHWIKNAQTTFSSGGENVAAGALQAIGSEGTIWRPSDRDLTPVATLRFDEDGNDARRVCGVVLREDIAQGQRVERVEGSCDTDFGRACEGGGSAAPSVISEFSNLRPSIPPLLRLSYRASGDSSRLMDWLRS